MVGVDFRYKFVSIGEESIMARALSNGVRELEGYTRRESRKILLSSELIMIYEKLVQDADRHA